MVPPLLPVAAKSYLVFLVSLTQREFSAPSSAEFLGRGTVGIWAGLFFVVGAALCTAGC